MGFTCCVSVFVMTIYIVCIGVTIVRVHLSCIVLRFMVVMGVICWMWVYVGIMGNRIMCINLDKLIRMWMRVHMGVHMVRSFVDDDWGLVTLHSHTTIAQEVGHFLYRLKKTSIMRLAVPFG